MLDLYVREGTLTELPISFGNCSGGVYNPLTETWLVMANSTGGTFAILNYELDTVVAAGKIGVNGADTEDLCLVDAALNIYAACAENNHIYVFQLLLDGSYTFLEEYVLPPKTTSNKGFEALTFDTANNCFYVAQERYPMILYRVDRTPGVKGDLHDLTLSGYEIPFNLDPVITTHSNHVSGLEFSVDNTLLFITQSGGGKVIEVDLTGNVLDVFDDIPGIDGANNFEWISYGKNQELRVGSEARHSLNLAFTGEVGQPEVTGIVSEQTIIKGTQANGYKTIQHQFVDHLNNVHTTSSRPVSPDFDIDANRAIVKGRLNQELIDVELNSYLKDLENDIDPFSRVPNFQSEDDVLKFTLKQTLSKKGHEAVKYAKILDRMGTLSDSKLKVLLSIDTAKTDEIRAWQIELKTASDILKKTELLP